MSRLNKKLIIQTERCKERLLIDGFDELSVMRNLTTLYSALDADNQLEFLEVFYARYLKTYKKIKKRPPTDDIYDLAELYLIDLLTVPNEVTKYTYDTEVIRKRDRAIESVNATQGVQFKQAEINKAMRYWTMQTGFYMDILCEDAHKRALKDAGVKRVRWYTLEDDKVCDACEDLDGEEFDIDDIPSPPHPRCRCHVEAI